MMKIIIFFTIISFVVFNSCSKYENREFDFPVADFGANITIIFAGDSISFSDQTESAITLSWLWSFGDGDTSTKQNPVHTYNSLGTYTVSLTATNSFGNDTVTKTNFISVKTVQQRLDGGETPQELHTLGMSLDSLYGKTYQGGLIFYLNTSNGTGLVVAPNNHSTGAKWGCDETEISGADGTAIGTGEQNTIDIENGCTEVGTAADICADTTIGIYSDWFLPSIDELSAMLPNLYLNGYYSTFSNQRYWSSSEHSAGYA